MPFSYAMDCSQNFIDSTTEYTSITALLCPVLRVFNILLYSSGVVFGLYVIYSAVKLSLAWGDPNGFEGAKWSITYAIAGFVIILAFFVIYRVVLKTIGIEGFGSVNEVSDNVESGLDVFRHLFGTCDGTSNNPMCR
jgi:uncharacterized Tic20 family protein